MPRAKILVSASSQPKTSGDQNSESMSANVLLTIIVGTVNSSELLQEKLCGSNHSRSPTVVNLSFLDRSCYLSLK
jgi:hypothetical protein